MSHVHGKQISMQSYIMGSFFLGSKTHGIKFRIVWIYTPRSLKVSYRLTSSVLLTSEKSQSSPDRFMTQINLTPHITRRPPLVSSVQHEGNKQGSLREDVVVSVSYMKTRTLIYAGLWLAGTISKWSRPDTKILMYRFWSLHFRLFKMAA